MGERRELTGEMMHEETGPNLLALEMDEGTMNQEMEAISRRWKGKEKDSLAEPRKGMKPC